MDTYYSRKGMECQINDLSKYCVGIGCCEDYLRKFYELRTKEETKEKLGELFGNGLVINL